MGSKKKKEDRGGDGPLASSSASPAIRPPFIYRAGSRTTLPGPVSERSAAIWRAGAIHPVADNKKKRDETTHICVYERPIRCNQPTSGDGPLADPSEPLSARKIDNPHERVDNNPEHDNNKSW